MSSEDTQSKLVKFYLRSVICVGGLTYVLAAYRLDLKIVDLKIGVLVIITGLLSSRMTIKIPQFGSWISVSDTFIFLTLLLYGCEAAILLAATEAFLSSIRSVYCRKWSTILFNWSVAAVATCVTAYVLRLFFGDPVALNVSPLSPRFITAVGLMALIQYATNSGMVAVLGALKANNPIWLTWEKQYLLTSIKYFSRASASSQFAKLLSVCVIYLVLHTIPG